MSLIDTIFAAGMAGGGSGGSGGGGLPVITINTVLPKDGMTGSGELTESESAELTAARAAETPIICRVGLAGDASGLATMEFTGVFNIIHIAAQGITAYTLSYGTILIMLIQMESGWMGMWDDSSAAESSE